MLLRRLFLFLSQQSSLRRWMETSSLGQRLTGRFVAGQNLEKGLAVCKRLNLEGFLVSLDHLGENVNSSAEADASREAYLQALDRIASLGLESTVSIKLTQLGLDLSEEDCRRRVAVLVRRAREIGSCIEVDMESSPYVEKTLRIVSDLHAGSGCVRAVIQAYLRRSRQDIEMLCERRIPVRLCKGAYQEPAELAYQNKSEVDENYARLMRTLLERGTYPAIATHDGRLIRRARRFISEAKQPPENFEFQMLYGISRKLQRSLIRKGFRLRVYVPYGDAWYPYFMRRLAERPANLFFLLRNLARR